MNKKEIKLCIKKHIFGIVILFWVIIDLYSKYLATIMINERFNILWDLIYLEYILNSWIAFSMQLTWIPLKIITISLIIWFFYYYLKEERKKKSLLIDISFWLIIAWAIWNWIERIFRWNVVDFIWVKYFSIFNLADSFITIWAVLFLFSIYILKRKKSIKS